MVLEMIVAVFGSVLVKTVMVWSRLIRFCIKIVKSEVQARKASNGTGLD